VLIIIKDRPERFDNAHLLMVLDFFTAFSKKTVVYQRMITKIGARTADKKHQILDALHLYIIFDIIKVIMKKQDNNNDVLLGRYIKNTIKIRIICSIYHSS